MIKVYIISQLLILPLIIYYIFCKKSSNRIFSNWNLHRIILIISITLPLLLYFKPIGINIESLKYTEIIESTKVVLEQELYTLNSNNLINNKNNLLEKTSIELKPSFNKSLFTIIILKYFLLALGLLFMMFSIIRDLKIISLKNRGVISKGSYNGIPILYSKNVSEPFSYGLIKPRIYMPINLTNEHENIIIKHEINHIINKHLLWLNIEVLLKKIFWFNPYYYLLNIYGTELRELICDEKTVMEINYIKYTEALLGEANKVFINSISTSLGWGNKSLLKKRVNNLLSNSKKVISKRDKSLNILVLLFTLALILLYPVNSFANENITLESKVLINSKTIFLEFLDLCRDVGTLKASEEYKFKMDDIINSIPKDKSGYPLGDPIVDGRATLAYGLNKDPFKGDIFFHSGIDLAYSRGSEILATGSGEIIYTDYEPEGLGNYIVIKHRDGLYTLYGQLDRIFVTKDEVVLKGDKIGLMGSTGRSTGPHLHYVIFYLPGNFPIEGLTKDKIVNSSLNPLFFLSPKFKNELLNVSQDLKIKEIDSYTYGVDPDNNY